jgi:predicted nucleic acid-binding protein
VIVLDTNVVSRLVQLIHPHHSLARDAIKQLHSEGNILGLTTTSIYELYFIFTKPSLGFGFTNASARGELANIRRQFQLVPEQPGTLDLWQSLVAKYNLGNRVVFDARIAATMLDHGYRQLLTFNDRDFSRFAELEVLNPFDVLVKPRL